MDKFNMEVKNGKFNFVCMNHRSIMSVEESKSRGLEIVFDSEGTHVVPVKAEWFIRESFIEQRTGGRPRKIVKKHMNIRCKLCSQYEEYEIEGQI